MESSSSLREEETDGDRKIKSSASTHSSPLLQSFFYEYICYMYVYVCLSGGGGALKQAPYGYHGNMSLWSFFAPFLQLDITNPDLLGSPPSVSSHPLPLSPLSLSLFHPLCNIKNFLFEDLSRFQVKPNAISGPIQHWVCGFMQRCVWHLCVRQKKYDSVCSCMEDVCGKPEVIGLRVCVCVCITTNVNKQPDYKAACWPGPIMRNVFEYVSAFECASVCCLQVQTQA